MENLFVVKYSGTFGFIKPWTAVRDTETFSQQFLTPSNLIGIEQKLFPNLLGNSKLNKIKRYRLNYCGLDIQQEVTWSKGESTVNSKISKDKYRTRNKGIINRGILIYPNLYLAFENLEDAEIAFTQSICLCRNEDLIYPEEIKDYPQEEFNNKIHGFELIETTKDEGFKVGVNRFDNCSEMYGKLIIIGKPIRNF